MPDLQSLHLGVLDISIATITPCVLGFITHEALLALGEKHPRLSRVLWREMLVCAAIYRQWLVNLGQSEAYSRIAHLLCETVSRLEAVGLAVDHRCILPVTQTELGDATGLTKVHVNRTLKQIRNAGLISWEREYLKVLDWEGLKQVAGFEPAYLHLGPVDFAA
jgi:CRP-like cAMP-binding protein